MSIFIDLPSLVVPAYVIDSRYPGGMDAFLDAIIDPDVPCRNAQCDGVLVAISFALPGVREEVEEMLTPLGIQACTDGEFGKMLWLEEPTIPAHCSWLECCRDPHGEVGFYCWLKGTTPSHIHPSGKFLEEPPEGDERFMRLASAESGDAWLDLQTGEVIEGSIQQSTGGKLICIERRESMSETEETPEDDDELVFGTPLLDSVREMLHEYNYKFQESDDNALFLIVRGPFGAHSVFLTTDEKREVVRVAGSYGPAIPIHRRAAVAEGASRANVRLGVGNFELDFGDGELRFRNSVDVEGGLFTTKMADNLLGCTLHTLDRFSDAFMRVAFSDITAEEAFQGVK